MPKVWGRSSSADVERPLARVLEPDRDLGVDPLVAVAPGVLQADLRARQRLAVAGGSRPAARPAPIEVAGLSSSAVVFQRSMCSSRSTACRAEASV